MAVLKILRPCILTGLFLVGVGFTCMAQPGPPPQAQIPPGKGPPNDPITDPDVPISGVEILLLAGGIFGAKKYFEHRKIKSTTQGPV